MSAPRAKLHNPISRPAPIQAPGFMLRKATMADARHLFEWRNDPQARAASVCQEVIPWSYHLGWLSLVLNDPHRELLVAELPGRIPVGSVRFDHRIEEWSISWSVSPDHRGRGLGGLIVGRAVQHANGQALRAVIRPNNHASIAIAVANGFSDAGTIGDLTIWRRPAAQANSR